jgi:hypothetical protein
MKSITLIGSVMLALALSAPAHAQNAVGDAYGGAGAISNSVTPSGDPTGAPAVSNAQSEVPASTAGSSAGAGADDAQGAVAADSSRVPATTAVASAAAATPALSGDRLPFTGLDVGLMLVGGVLLLALGFGMRRLARPTMAG